MKRERERESHRERKLVYQFTSLLVIQIKKILLRICENCVYPISSCFCSSLLSCFHQVEIFIGYLLEPRVKRHLPHESWDEVLFIVASPVQYSNHQGTCSVTLFVTFTFWFFQCSLPESFSFTLIIWWFIILTLSRLHVISHKQGDSRQRSRLFYCDIIVA